MTINIKKDKDKKVIIIGNYFIDKQLSKPFYKQKYLLTKDTTENEINVNKSISTQTIFRYKEIRK